MNTIQLRYFLVLAKELHYGNAARKLNITQPPLSRSIQQLEENLGVQLFVRTNRQVNLTLAGEYLLASAERLFQDLDTIKKEIRTLSKGKTGKLHLSLLGSTISLIFPFVKKLLIQSPQICLRISQYTTKEQLDMVLSGKVDIAFLRGPVHSFGLPVKHFIKEGFVLICAKKHQNKIMDGNILSSLSKEPFISFPRELGEGLFDTIIALCHDQNFIPNISHTANNMTDLVYMVEEDMGFSIIPKSCAKSNSDRLSIVDMGHLPFHSMICYYYNHENNNPVIHNFISLLQRKS